MQLQPQNDQMLLASRVPGILDTYLEEHKNDPEIIAESLAISIMEDAVRILQEKGMSRSELSDLMNVSRGYVTRLFNTPPNLTLLSLARLSVALDVEPYVGLSPKVPVDVEVRMGNANITHLVKGRIVPSTNIDEQPPESHIPDVNDLPIASTV